MTTLPTPAAPQSLAARHPAGDGCLHRMVEAQAARTPSAPALIWAGGCLTYARLNGDANRLARHLRRHGVAPGVLVAVCAESGPEMVVALLAVLKAGGAYVPLDPAYPAERLAFMLDDTAAPLVLTLSRLRDVLPTSSQSRVLCLDADAALWGGERGDDLDGGAGPDDLAYVIYTSGSTGKPKGVLLAHRGAHANLGWRQEAFPLDESDRMLQSYSFSFDPSVWAIFWPLVSGAALVLPRPGGLADPGYLVETLVNEDITVAGFGPALLRTLLARPEFARCRMLRHLFCGGEALPPDLPALAHARLPRTALHNVYGPTEATIDAAWWTVPRGWSGAVVPIGFPAAQSELFVLNGNLTPVPDGEAGELYVGGIGLARGYHARPDLTQQSFLPHPFDRTPGARLYRTGDLVRRGPDGALLHLGRIDSQVKIRGFRIELGEIEAALCAHPLIQDAIVARREDGPEGCGGNEPRLVAYFVTAGDPPADLRDWLSQTLPAHMVPALFVRLVALPLTPSGKRDRTALPPPGAEAGGRVGAAADFLPPRDALERQIARVWEELLDVRPVGLRDSFWDLGGHSLLAARLLDQVGAACGRAVPLSALYEGGTVEHLADLLRRPPPDPSDGAAPCLTRIAPDGSRRPFFFLYGFHPLGGFYCHSLVRRFPAGQPLYALHPPVVRGAGRLTIEALASEYVGVLRAAQPHGPYRLGGFCGAGLIAFEMARQLTARGEAVEFLALIEVHAINARFRLALRRLTGGPRAFGMAQRVLSPAVAAAQGWWQAWRGRAAPGLIAALDRAAGAYVPGFYAGPLALFRACDDPETFAGDPVALWREAAPGLTAHDVPGTHLGCLLEHVGGLGDALGAGLDALDC